jgi:hypothetical protein
MIFKTRSTWRSQPAGRVGREALREFYVNRFILAHVPGHEHDLGVANHRR